MSTRLRDLLLTLAAILTVGVGVAAIVFTIHPLRTPTQLELQGTWYVADVQSPFDSKYGWQPNLDAAESIIEFRDNGTFDAWSRALVLRGSYSTSANSYTVAAPDGLPRGRRVPVSILGYAGAIEGLFTVTGGTVEIESAGEDQLVLRRDGVTVTLRRASLHSYAGLS